MQINLFVLEALGYGKDVKGTDPADKDYNRMQDILKKSGGNEAKALELVTTMARAISRGGGSASKDKAMRRAQAALEVLKGKLGQKAYDIFMDVAGIKSLPRATA